MNNVDFEELGKRAGYFSKPLERSPTLDAALDQLTSILGDMRADGGWPVLSALARMQVRYRLEEICRFLIRTA
jgi:hypothetical protein